MTSHDLPNPAILFLIPSLGPIRVPAHSQNINALGKKARDGTIGIDDMAGGTFTISNGGVYGSMMSTPIINPPQSAILGMHAINQRPVAVDGKVEIRPMMYIALTYDHRLIDGREVRVWYGHVFWSSEHFVCLSMHVHATAVLLFWCLSCALLQPYSRCTLFNAVTCLLCLAQSFVNFL